MKQEKFLDIPRSPHFSVSKWWESSQKEKKDVDKLQGKSIAGIFYAIIGRKVDNIIYDLSNKKQQLQNELNKI